MDLYLKFSLLFYISVIGVMTVIVCDLIAQNITVVLKSILDIHCVSLFGFWRHVTFGH